MELKLKSIDDIDINIIFTEPKVYLSESDLNEGSSLMNIKKIYINDIELKADKNIFCDAFIDIGIVGSQNSNKESHLFLVLKNKLAQQYYKILDIKETFDFANIQIKDEFISDYSSKVTVERLKALNKAVEERFNRIYKQDLCIKDTETVFINYVDSEYKVKIENYNLSIIAYRAETVLSDAKDKFKDFEVENILTVGELKSLIKELANKLQYENEYLEEDLFNV